MAASVLGSRQGFECFWSQISGGPCRIEVETRRGWDFEGTTTTEPLTLTSEAYPPRPILLRPFPDL